MYILYALQKKALEYKSVVIYVLMIFQFNQIEVTCQPGSSTPRLKGGDNWGFMVDKQMPFDDKVSKLKHISRESLVKSMIYI